MKSRLTVCILMSNYFLFGLLLNSIGVLILQSMQTFNVGKDDAKFLEGCKDISIAIVSFLAASLIPRIGYQRSMSLGLGLVMMACLSMPTFASFLTTKIFLVAVGAAFAFVKISIYSTIGLITKSAKEHASKVNSVEAVFTLGVLSGYWLFGAFIDPVSPGNFSWLNTFWVLAGLSATNLLLTIFLMPDEMSHQLRLSDQKAESHSGCCNMIRLAFLPLAYVFIMSAFLYVLVEQGISSWLPTYNKEILKLPTIANIQLASAFAFSLILGRISAGYLLRTFNWLPVLSICVVIIIILIMLTLSSRNSANYGDQVTWYNLPFSAYLFPIIGFFSPRYTHL